MMTKKLSLLILSIGLTIVSYSQTIPNYVPQSGLVGWWPFDSNANDLTINARHGQIHSYNNTVHFVDGKEDNAIYLTGQGHVGDFGDHILIPAIGFNNMPSWTVTMWVKQDGNTGSGGGHGEAFITGRRAIDECRMNFSMDFQGYYPNYSVGMGVHDGAQVGNVNFQGGKWNFFSLTVSPGTVKGYLNGQLFNTSTGLTDTYEESVLGIGTHWFCPGIQSTRFIGAVDNLGIWNRALSQSEITNLYNLGIVTNVSKNFDSENISVYPNPVSDQLNIKTKAEKMVSIYNTIGVKVVDNTICDGNLQLNVKNLPRGIYYVNLYNSENGQTNIRRIELN
jgi:hypothetical protein